MEEKNTDALNLVLTAFTRNNEAMFNRREAWKDYYAYYNQTYPDPEDEDQYTNNSFDPILAEKMETYRPFLCRRIPDLQFVPREDSDADTARKHEYWQRYMWYRQGMKQKRQAVSFFAGLLGTAALFHFYRKEEQEVWTRKFVDGVARETTEMMTVYDDPDCEVIDVMNDFFPDSIGTDIDSCRNIVFRQYFHVDKLRTMAKGRDPWITNLPEELEEAYDGFQIAEKKNELDRFNDNHNLTTLAEAGIVELLNYWEDNRLIIVGHRSWVLRDSKNPFKALRKKKPFSLFKFLDDPLQFWGKGLGDLCVKTQYTANVLERLIIDAAKQALRRGAIAPFGAGVDISPLYEGEKYVVEGPASGRPMEFLPAPNFSNIGMITRADLRSRADSVTGAPPLFAGMTGGGGDSATESRIMQSNLMQRAIYVLGNQDFGYSNWMKKNVAMAAQYYPEKKDYRIYAEGGGGLFQGTITYDELMSGVDVEVKSNSGQPITADDRSLQADQMLARFGQDQWFRPRPLRETAMKMMELPVDSDKLLYSEQEMAQQQQAQMQAAKDQDDREKQHELRLTMARAMFKDASAEEAAMAPVETPAGVQQ